MSLRSHLDCRAARQQPPGFGGLTLLNFHRPRDRSHYERFRHYHETFKPSIYREVEVGSVTPFSARALDRGLAGALVALARHHDPHLTPPAGVQQLAQVRVDLERRLQEAFHDRIQHQPFAHEEEREHALRSVRDRIVDLLDSWQKVVDDYAADGVALQYQEHESSQPRPLLHDLLDELGSEHEGKFRVNRSLRDVEPNVNLFLKELSGAEVTDPS